MTNKKELTWIEAIQKVLQEEKRALHYTEIAELIIQRQYRYNVGATPANTVNANLTTNISNPTKTIFAKVGNGEYILKELTDDTLKIEKTKPIKDVKKEYSETKLLIESMGIFWNREMIQWKNDPDMFGVQSIGAKPVNFNKQVGIYLLHDLREIIYVGQAIDQSIGKRLFQHTTDRFSGRWNRFSWFGFYGVKDDGLLNYKKIGFKNITFPVLADTIEAILIESIEPRQNRKKGNTFSGIEYLQFEDPEIIRKKKQQLLKELSENI